MRIGLVLSGLEAGGAQRRVVTLARSFAGRGHDVEIACARPQGAFAGELGGDVALVDVGGALARVPVVDRRRSLRLAASLPRLRGWLREGGFDVVMTSSTPASLATLAARDSLAAAPRSAASSPPPVVVTVNVPLSASTDTWRRPMQAALVRRLYPRADAAIAVSRAVADDVVRFAGVESSRVHAIANPIDAARIAKLAAAEPVHAWASDRNVLPGDGTGRPVPLVVVVGKLKRQKDLPTALRAFAAARRQRDARLLLLGGGEEEPALRQLSRTLGVDADVDFAGVVQNPFAIVARASLLLSSSRWEGFSNAVAEALACGCPVVAADCPGGLRELLVGECFGRLVPVGDAAAMAAAIVATLDEAPDREALRARAREFPVERAVDAYLGVLAMAARASGIVSTNGAVASAVGGSPDPGHAAPRSAGMAP